MLAYTAGSYHGFLFFCGYLLSYATTPSRALSRNNVTSKLKVHTDMLPYCSQNSLFTFTLSCPFKSLITFLFPWWMLLDVPCSVTSPSLLSRKYLLRNSIHIWWNLFYFSIVLASLGSPGQAILCVLDSISSFNKWE